MLDFEMVVLLLSTRIRPLVGGVSVTPSFYVTEIPALEIFILIRHCLDFLLTFPSPSQVFRGHQKHFVKRNNATGGWLTSRPRSSSFAEAQVPRARLMRIKGLVSKETVVPHRFVFHDQLKV